MVSISCEKEGVNQRAEEHDGAQHPDAEENFLRRV